MNRRTVLTGLSTAVLIGTATKATEIKRIYTSWVEARNAANSDVTEAEADFYIERMWALEKEVVPLVPESASDFARKLSIVTGDFDHELSSVNGDAFIAQGRHLAAHKV